VEFAEYSLADHATVSTAQASGLIEFVDPCLDPFDFALSSSPQVDPNPDNYSGVPVTATLTPFVISPSRCSVSYSCGEVLNEDGSPSTTVSCSDFSVSTVNTVTTVSLSGATRQNYLDGTFPPGVYRFKVKGTAVTSGTILYSEIKFTFTDPCDPPQLI
jgi:hypothetical protein